MTSPLPGRGTDISNRRAWAMVVTLALLSIVAFIDRQVLAVLVGGIEHDLVIGDVAFGLLLGPAFIVTYNVVLIPLAFLIDARNRKWLIVGAVALWCTMTLLTATARGFNDFAFYRSGLAIGEAVLGPAVVSLIGDLFDRERRAFPMAIYMTGSTIGLSGAALFGAAALQAAAALHDKFGWFDGLATWRLVLVLVAIPGFVLVALLAVIAREPVRGATVAAGREAERDGEGFTTHLRTSWLPYLLIALFSGCVNMLAVALSLWGPAYFIRAFALTPVASGYLVGSVSLVCGVAGVLLVPALLRRHGRGRDPEHSLIAIAAVSFAISVPAVLLYGFAPGLGWALVGLGIATIALTSIFSLAAQFVQLRTPSRLRAKAQAMMLFIVFLIGGGIGPVLLPFVAGAMFTGPDALGRSTAMLAIGSAIVAAPILWFLIHHLARGARPVRDGHATSLATDMGRGL